jgi:hypothetical protein
MGRNKWRPHDLVQHQPNETRANRNRPMNSRITDSHEGIDRKTSRSICDAVGERLQQDLRPDAPRLSSHLQHLMDELRRRDNETHQSLPN